MPLLAAAEHGFTAASLYDIHRPSYPASAVSNMIRNLQVEGLHGARIVDLAAGTGKLTELLAAREEEFEILAIEPHEGMRMELERKQLRGVRVLEGEAGRMGVERGSVDAVVCAQDNKKFELNYDGSRFAHEEALREIHRVLIPGGVFGMIWNIEDYNAPKSWIPQTRWESKIKDITWSFDDDNARFRHERWREVFEKQLSSTPFSIVVADPLFSLPLGEDSTDFTVWLSRQAIWERYRTLSQISVLKEEELKNVKEKVFEAINEPDVESNANGELALHGHTISAWTSAIPVGPLKEGG